MTDNVSDINKSKASRDKYEQEKREQISAHFEKLDTIAHEITALQEKRKEMWAILVAEGWNKPALEAAYKYSNMTEKQRENYDNSYVYGRSLGDNPMQHDLFMAEVNARFLFVEEKEEQEAAEG